MKTILIVGAKSDIAKAIAREFFTKGFELILAARNVQDLEFFVAELPRQDNKVQLCEYDALDFESHATFFGSLSPKPNIVVFCVGYLGDQKRAQSDFSEAKRIFDTNLTSAVSILELAARNMMDMKQGSIIGISSVAGERGRMSNYMYGSAKAGFTAYLSGLRQRLSKEGIHVLSVKPGYVATKMTAGMNLSPFLTTSPESLAKAIYKAYESKKDVLYFKSIWSIIMFIIRSIPEFIFKKLNF